MIRHDGPIYEDDVTCGKGIGTNKQGKRNGKGHLNNYNYDHPECGCRIVGRLMWFITRLAAEVRRVGLLDFVVETFATHDDADAAAGNPPLH